MSLAPPTPADMLATLARLAESGALEWVDYALARRLTEADARERGAPANSDADALALAAALASERMRAGDSCVMLAEFAGQAALDGVVIAPTVAVWRASLRRSAMVMAADDERVLPLVLDSRDRLYLHRYWHYEQILAAQLRRLAQPPRLIRLTNGLPSASAALPDLAWAHGLDPSQRDAVELVLTHRLAVIAGGPGAGKTRTVAHVLARLLAERGDGYRIALVAPTGKAAARLAEAMAPERLPFALLDALPAEFAAQWPREVQTIQRLLRPYPRSTRFRHDADDPLPVDCLVVDEASMVDLALAAKLLQALPPTAQLVLLGDPDQLASVEAGAVFASLCTIATLPNQAAATLAQCVVTLVGSHRFGDGSAIARLAAQVRTGDADAVIAALAQGGTGVAWVALESQILVDAVRSGYAGYVEAVRAQRPPLEVLDALDRFRVLAAHRRGALGTERLNSLMDAELARPSARRDPWYPGRAVMVTENDYGLGLYNGDVGVTLADASGVLKVFFRDRALSLREVPPAHLPACDTAFALTVHKSQGSEFDEVLLVLPEERSRIVSRELLYTAITRARSRLAIAGTDEVIRAAVASPQIRRSGLVDALMGNPCIPLPAAGPAFGLAVDSAVDSITTVKPAKHPPQSAP